LDLPALAEKLKTLGDLKQNEYLLRLIVGEYELTVFRDARAIVRGTDDVSTARSVYAKYVGV
jgi:adenylyltransferase/sulfurtransferase